MEGWTNQPRYSETQLEGQRCYPSHSAHNFLRAGGPVANSQKVRSLETEPDWGRSIGRQHSEHLRSARLRCESNST